MAASRLDASRFDQRVAFPIHVAERRVGDDLIGQGEGGADQLCVRDGLEDEPDPGCLRTVDPSPGETSSAARVAPTIALQQPAQPQLGARRADLDERIDEESGGRGQPEVGPQGQGVAGPAVGP